jgi:transcriptional regulator with XRE-family HTH domain
MPATKQEVAQLVKTSREAKGLTQQQLAELAAVSVHAIQQIERGEVMSSYYTLKTLATQLSFSAEILRDNSSNESGNFTKKLIVLVVHNVW